MEVVAMLAIYDGREAFYQWDSGQKLLVTHEGVCEVHYKQPGEETALAVNTYDQDGQTVADVPNILLQEAGKLTAYIYVCVGDACTVKKAIFTIKPRPKPADYVYTETEVKTYSALEKRLDEIEANGVSDERIEKAVAQYLEEHPIEGDGSESETGFVLTATGVMVNVTALPQPVQALVSTVGITQAGSGTPSISNRRPIHGYDEVSLYHGTAYDIMTQPKLTANLPEIVYGGTMDWLTGTMTVTHALYTPSGAAITTQGVASTSMPYVRFELPAPMAAERQAVCDLYPLTAGVPQAPAFRIAVPNTGFIYDDRFTDRATAEALLDAEKPQIVYKLETPQIIQYDPATLTMLDGKNALWSNTGETSVKYAARAKDYIDAVDKGIPTKPEDIGAQPAGDYALRSEIPTVPVQSVNGATGDVVLTAADVGARPDTWMPTAADVGALPADTEIPAPYTLPVASADTLGGVKVGEGLQMTGDALGVKPEKFDLIETITLTEPSVILRTQEPDGTPYNFEAVVVKAKTVTPAADPMYGYYHTSKGQLLRVYQSNPNCTNGQVKQRVDIIERKGQYLCAMFLDWGYEYMKIDPNHYMTVKLLDTENIVKIDWRQTLAAGTTIEIWGVRANA